MTFNGAIIEVYSKRAPDMHLGCLKFVDFLWHAQELKTSFGHGSASFLCVAKGVHYKGLSLQAVFFSNAVFCRFIIRFYFFFSGFSPG